jgi:Na+:H+ antiporter, NhaA family
MGTRETDNGGPGGDLAGPDAALPGRRMPRVLRQFLATESAGGLVLLVAAVVALVWANSPWHSSYETLWHTELSVGVGRFVLVEDLRHWVNDGLMALFFFVVGLEIKRELVHGDLREPRVAAMPAIAALGGMVVPALLFLLVTVGGGGAKGWGIPMATDIAFAIGVVALLGSRVPASLKLFLLTLAIVDDIGAIVVIALFYATEVQPVFIATAVGIVVVMLVMRRAGVVWTAPYVVLGVGVWLATQASGVHATIAGVALGLLAPARALSPAAVTRQWVRDLSDDPGPAELAVMNRLAQTTVSPAERLEHLLHPWTSFAVVPLFALANAGVVIKADSFDASGTVGVTAGVVLGLVVGKVVGISAATWLAVRCGLGRLPQGATWAMVVGIAAIGGIGFTVSLFIAELAFEPGAIQDAAKLGVLGASTVAALLGAALLTRACRGNSRG